MFEETGFFNIYLDTVEIRLKSSVNERAPLGPDPNETEESIALKSKTLFNFELPLLAGRTIMLPEYVKHLRDHHIIKRALKDQEEEEMMNSGGGSIFDDFLGFGKKTEAKKETKQKKGIEIDESLMIETISDFYCHQGYAILSLVLAYEHKQ